MHATATTVKIEIESSDGEELYGNLNSTIASKDEENNQIRAKKSGGAPWSYGLGNLEATNQRRTNPHHRHHQIDQKTAFPRLLESNQIPSGSEMIEERKLWVDGANDDGPLGDWGRSNHLIGGVELLRD